MKTKIILLYLFLFFCQTLTSLFGETKGKLFIVPLQEEINKPQLYIIRRAFKEAKKANASAVILDIDTPGGRVDITEEIISWIRSFDGPVYAYVNPRAQSAGAIISFACNKIYMSPGSRIGSAMPILLSPTGGAQEIPESIQEKISSDIRAMVRGLAQENNHSEDVAVAMVDSKKEVIIGEKTISKKGELLNLTALEAVEKIRENGRPLLAEKIVENMNELILEIGQDKAEVKYLKVSSAEQLSRWITTLAPIFLALGILGIYVEIKTPGFGIPGILGALFLGIFFFGHFVAGLAGMEELAFVLVGIILLSLEIFVIPGFGITGMLGILCIFAGIAMGMIPYIPDAPPLPMTSPASLDIYINQALLKLFAALAIVGGAGFLLGKILPKTPFFRQLILDKIANKQDGFVSSDIETNKELIGKIGKTVTPLHPTGVAFFEEERIDIVSSGDMIEEGQSVIVTEVHGSRIVVERVINH
ncbi:MAG: NfeD family protein [Verrucomicrobiota bacterium]|nr:NfeD family protein [Verrucomicrobiota bacterium]